MKRKRNRIEICEQYCIILFKRRDWLRLNFATPENTNQPSTLNGIVKIDCYFTC